MMSFISGLKYPIKRGLLSVSTMRVPVPGGVGGGERPDTTFLAESVDGVPSVSGSIFDLELLALVQKAYVYWPVRLVAGVQPRSSRLQPAARLQKANKGAISGAACD